MKILKDKKFLKIILWTLTILWMSFLFIMSSKVREESNSLSEGLTQVVIEATEDVVPELELDLNRLNYILRKNAHFFGYLILGILVFQALKVSQVKGFKLYMFSLIFCITYAISDEIHQHFVPGRSGEIRDVFIDGLGATLGISISFFINKYSIRRER